MPMTRRVPRTTPVSMTSLFVNLSFIGTIPQLSLTAQLRPSTEKHRTRPRAVDLRVAGRAVGVLRVLVMLRPGRFRRADVVSQAVASQTKLIDRAEAQQTRICRTVRRVASRATDVVAPMLTTPEIVVLFFTGMTAKTGLGNFFR